MHVITAVAHLRGPGGFGNLGYSSLRGGGNGVGGSLLSATGTCVGEALTGTGKDETNKLWKTNHKTHTNEFMLLVFLFACVFCSSPAFCHFPLIRSQVQQMIMDESVEEDHRAEALARAAGHPLRSKRLQLRHEQEREEKRILINWIRKDIEVSTRC